MPRKTATRQTAIKTTVTRSSVKSFIDGIADEARRREARSLLALLKRATGETPRLWGESIVGFGSYHYKYATGREGDWFVTGFAPRKGSLTVYVLPGLHLHTANMRTLGKFTTGKSCIYIKRLTDVDLPTLERMAKQACADTKKTVK